MLLTKGAGCLLGTHEHSFHWLTCSLSVRAHTHRDTPAGSLSWLIHFQCTTHYSSALFRDCWHLLALSYSATQIQRSTAEKKKAAKGLLNKSISRVSLSACLCVFVPRPREREICTSLLVGMWERTIVYISIYGDLSNMHYFKTWRKTGQPLQHSQKNVFFICS